MQFVTGIFFISAFVLRFVFPTFGSERKSAWLLATAPIKMTRVYWAKLWFFTSIFTTLGILIVAINLSHYGVSFLSFGFSMIIFISSVIFIIVYGLSLGAIFPNFETDDPSALSTSLPGLGFIVGSLIYGTLGGFLLYKAYVVDVFWWVFLFELMTLFGIVVLTRVASRKINTAEFVKIK